MDILYIYIFIDESMDNLPISSVQDTWLQNVI